MSKATYSHLDESALGVIDGPDEQRIRHIQSDRFVPHRNVQTVLSNLDVFLRRPISIRPPCMALVGDAGSGKTSLLAEFIRRVHLEPGEVRAHRVCYCVADALPTQPVLQAALLGALGSTTGLTRRNRYEGDELIRRAIAELRTRVVIIDEVQHILNLPRRDRDAIWDWIKWVSTANKVTVVAAGVPGFEQMIAKERQLQTRFEIIQLPRWSAGPALGQFLAAFERSLPLRRPSGLSTPEMQARLLRETFAKQQVTGITHGIKQVIEAAAIEAIRSGDEKITARLLAAWRGIFENATSKEGAAL